MTLASDSVRGSFEILDGDRLGIFDIDKDTGMISTTKLLDRERQSAFELKVAVAVVGAASKTFSECVVNIEVQDLNDNVPSFEKNEPKLILAETNSAIGQPIHRVVANDPDDGDNGRIGFRLEDKTGYFAIDENSGKKNFQQENLLKNFDVAQINCQYCLFLRCDTYFCCIAIFYIQD